MDTKEIQKRIEAAVADYVECDQAWGDAPMLEINPETFEMDIVDEESDDSFHYVDMMELLRMSVTTPGAWEPDPEAIETLALSYKD